MSEETFRAGGVVATWDPDARVLRHTYARDARPTSEDARRMQAWTDAHVGVERPFDILVDVGGAGVGATGWRFRWMTWAYRRRAQIRIAVFHAERISPLIVSGFAAATRTRIRAFPGEAEARAWLALAEPI